MALSDSDIVFKAACTEALRTLTELVNLIEVDLVILAHRSSTSASG